MATGYARLDFQRYRCDRGRAPYNYSGRSRFAADGSGYLLPQPMGAPVWFVVFENRLGRLPPYNRSPTA